MRIDLDGSWYGHRRLADRFKAGSGEASSENDLRTLLEEAALELGFDHFALVHHVAPHPNRQSMIRIHNYPAEWEMELELKRLAAIDPVHAACRRTHAGFTWSELGDLVEMGRPERDLLERAGAHGIADGFTVPVSIPGEPAGSCSFAVSPGRELPRRRLLCAEQVGLHAFKTARRLAHHRTLRPPPKLSPREQQCVRLVAAGKTDWEIAAILAISIETAHQYVKRARSAYNVCSRAQLVACALRDGLICFDEAIPPNG